jgi:hypothetical protein
VIKNDAGKEETFTVDLKREGAVIKGKGPNKADAILSLKDTDFIDLSAGKLNGKSRLNIGDFNDNTGVNENAWFI